MVNEYLRFKNESKNLSSTQHFRHKVMDFDDNALDRFRALQLQQRYVFLVTHF